MADFALSSDRAVQDQLDRLTALSPGADILGLERITRLLERLGNPHHRLPPVFHVAGTNGKGSTCAFLRAALEADGYKVHVYTSPHLVRFNERIRIAGQLIDDATLAEGLSDILDQAEDLGASFFEITTALAFRLFADTPADACVIEVGLGGRLDATNVLTAPAACGVAQLGLDHQAFLGDHLTDIAREKASIAKPGAPILTQRYPVAIARIVAAEAQARGAIPHAQGESWDVAAYQGKVHYRDAAGRLDLPTPVLAGLHQLSNMGLAIAMLRHQSALPISDAALKAAPHWAQWPARLQRLEHGPLLAAFDPERPVWLDGGHNPAAGTALASHFDKALAPGERMTLVVGMLANKDVAGFLEPLWSRIAELHSLPVQGHAHHDGTVFAELAASHGVPHYNHATLADAIAAVAAQDRPLLITGTLYLAGEVLDANGQAPV
ncbi:bifunctional folylpolyglutamate synthase/dihydrofolate synthase [Sphingobium sufflavum]|uniref:bifunctional folylpolyglutamate synthase/dihydrofolate synthase n=1 Tax=Sphingobium sufflavum TaxID=1129547 RepID=UPI001F3CB923|nr:folylpolyglutamate synthase/dihydrofolate synthase family protein [Sphingobium sufflavum]MCE7797033.1 bifunctional folylpolyglutamate synthase/dihydrofolate synthase [Sphingobium sufflavum]